MSPKVDFSQAGRSPEVEQMLIAVKGSLGHALECLVEIVAARVVEVASIYEPEKPLKLLLRKQELAEAWGCSESTIDRLRTEGLPTLMVGESPRWEPIASMEWLRSRSSH